MIGQHHGVQLDGLDEVRVVAEDAGDASLADLLELSGAEGRRLVAQFVPEAIAAPHVAELGGDDAGESGAQQTARQRSLRHAARPQVDVVRRSERSSRK